MTNAMDRCPTGKKGRHDLMAFYNPEDQTIPATAMCSMCGMSKQVPLTWTGEGSLDNRTAEEINEAIGFRSKPHER